MSDRRILIEAISHYGEKNQVIKAIEEMSELQKELCKYLTAESTADFSYPNIAEEIADAEIMLEQLKIIFRSEVDIITIKEFKLKRLSDKTSK